MFFYDIMDGLCWILEKVVLPAILIVVTGTIAVMPVAFVGVSSHWTIGPGHSALSYAVAIAFGLAVIAIVVWFLRISDGAGSYLCD